MPALFKIRFDTFQLAEYHQDKFIFTYFLPLVFV